jgi:predicted RNA methylase
MKPLSAEAIAIFSDGIEVVNGAARIVPKLDRKLYVEVNAALEAIGGKWNRKAQKHLFDADPADAIDQILVDGGFFDKKRDLNQFFTPPELARDIVRKADVAGQRCLEPSAGEGALVKVMLEAGAASVRSFEIDPVAWEKLVAMKYPNGSHNPAEPIDFLKTIPKPEYDRVVMNPPFARGQDIEHVTHAIKFLAPGGRLVSVMSAGVQFRQDRKATAFRELVARRGGTIEALPEQAFRSSGTDVRTVLVRTS